MHEFSFNYTQGRQGSTSFGIIYLVSVYACSTILSPPVLYCDMCECMRLIVYLFRKIPFESAQLSLYFVL